MANRKEHKFLLRLGAKLEASFGSNMLRAEKALGNIEGKTGKVTKEMMKVTATIAGIGVGAAKAAIDFEDAFAGVTKTVDGTPEQLENIRVGIRNMAKEIPSAATDIAAIAENAGQLGIETASVLGFTRVMADLGVATNLSGEEAAQTLAKFANITSMDQSNFNKLGSTIVSLGNNLATTEADIANMGMNLAAAGKQIGLNEPQILSMAGALSSLGLEAQGGGTSFSKFMLNMQKTVQTGGKKLDQFAKVANMTTKNFQKVFKQDAVGAIDAFLRGLGKLDNKSAILDQMGMKETRLSDALLRASGANDLFSRSMELGSKAWEENTALTDEAAKKYETTSSKLSILKNKVVDLGISFGEKLLPHIQSLMEKLEGAVEWFGNLDDSHKETIVNLSAVAAAIGPMLIISSKVIGAVKTITTTVKTAATAFGTAKLAIAALSGPVGWVVGGLALATTAYFVIKDAQEKAYQATLNFADGLVKASENYKKVSESTKNTRALIDEYRALEQKTKDVAISADNAAAAKSRMKDIEDILINQNPDVLDKYIQENGKISENLDLLERKMEHELAFAKIQLEQRQYEAKQKLPDAIKEIDGLKQKSEALAAQYAAQKKVRDGLQELIYDWDLFCETNPGEIEKQMRMDELTTKARELGEAVGQDWQNISALNVYEHLSEYQDKVDNTANDISKAKADFDTVNTSVNAFYDTSKALIELDLGGNFETVTANLATMQEQLANLQKNGKGGSDEALALSNKMQELSPKVEAAAIKIQELNNEVAEVPEVKTINVEDAVKGIDGLIEKLNKLPSQKTISINFVGPMPEAKLPGFASGGIITKPTLATFAEKGPEAAIPLDGSARAISLWEKAGRILGVFGNGENAGTPMAAVDKYLSNNSGQGGTVGVGSYSESPIDISMTVNINGSSGLESIKQAVSMTEREFEKMFERLEAKKKRLSFKTKGAFA